MYSHVLLLLLIFVVIKIRGTLCINQLRFQQKRVFSPQFVYSDINSLGKRVLKDKKVIFCGLLRDKQDRVNTLLDNIEQLGKYCDDYSVVIFENDSVDSTRKLLELRSQHNKRVHIIGSNYSMKKTQTHDVDEERLARMCFLRNQCLNYIRENLPFETFDFTVMWDMDLECKLHVDHLWNSMYYMDSYYINAVCAYSLIPMLAGNVFMYHDTFAHVENGMNHLKKGNKDIHLKTLKTYPSQHTGYISDLKKVDSAFGGLCIYRTNELVKHNYSVTRDLYGDLECEHVNINRKLGGVYINPYMKLMITDNSY